MKKEEMSFGIEVELPLAPRQVATLFPECSLHNDGSLRQRWPEVNGISLVNFPHNLQLRFAPVRWCEPYGTELVSPIMDWQQAMSFATRVAKFASSVPYQTNTGIHIHVDVRDQPWRYVQKCIGLAYKCEAGIFRIAAAGQRHRGEENDYKYTRPLSAPPVVFLRRASVNSTEPCVDMDAWFDAKSATDLGKAWGYAHLTVGRTYVPHRLMFINFFATLRKGSLEWRVFDARYQYLPDFVRFVAAFHEAVAKRTLAEIKAMETFELGTNMPMAILFDRLGISSAMAERFQRLWGVNVPIPVREKHPVSHYDGQQIRRVVVDEEAKLVNSRDEVDTGKEDFTF